MARHLLPTSKLNPFNTLIFVAAATESTRNPFNVLIFVSAATESVSLLTFINLYESKSSAGGVRWEGSWVGMVYIKHRSRVISLALK